MTSIKDQLAEKIRTSLVRYCIENKPSSIKGSLSNEDNLYDFNQMDNQVGAKVITSPVAEAIESCQSYLNSAYANVLPGHYTLDNQKKDHWHNIDKSFNLWAANYEKIYLNTENYIDPTLRNNKTEYFQNFESQISQAPLKEAVIQKNLLHYINQFEKVANLKLMSAFLESKDFPGAKCFFIAKEINSTDYFWRSFSLEDFDITKPHNLNPMQWSEWKKINVSIPIDNLVNVRPVYFNNRLYVVWAVTGQKKVQVRSATGTMDTTTTFQNIVKVEYSYLSYDGSWTAPKTLIDYDARDDDTIANSQITMSENQTNIKSSPRYGSEIVFTNLTVTTHTANHTAEDYIDIVLWGKLISWSSSTTSLSDNSEFGTGTDKFPAEKSIPLMHLKYHLDDEVEKDLFYLFHVIKYTHNVENKQITDLFCSYKIKDNSATDQIDNRIKKIRDHFRHNIGLENFENPVLFPFYDALGFELSSLALKGEMASIFNITSTNINRYSDYIYSFLNIASISQIKAPKDEFSIEFNLDFKNITDNIDFKTDLKTKYESNNYVELAIKNLTIKGIGDSKDIIPVIAPVEGNKDIKKIKIVKQGNEAITYQFTVQQEIEIILTPKDQKPKTNVVKNTRSINDIITGLEQQTGLHLQGMHLATLADFYNPQGLSSLSLIGETLATKEKKSVIIEYNLKIYSPELPKFSMVLGKNNGIDSLLFHKGDAILNMSINCNFVHYLVQNATQSLDKFFSSQTDQRLSAPLTEIMPYSIYMWELFFHVPFLVAWKLNASGHFQEAEKWYNFIFDPYKIVEHNDKHKDKYWNTIFFKDTYKISYPTTHQYEMDDPDANAYSHPEIYKKAVFIAYVKNLIDWGDSLFRKLTRDSLVEAKLIYRRALKLLGQKPLIPYSDWEPKTLNVLAENYDSDQSDLYTFEKSYTKNLLTKGLAKSLTFVSSASSRFLHIEAHPDFKKPVNKKLWNLWDISEFRMYCLRNSLTIDGKPMILPLYSSTTGLSNSYFRKYGSIDYAAGEAPKKIPYYRFKSLLQRAYYFVDMLSRFADMQLSYETAKESFQFEELQRQHALDMSDLTLKLHENSLTISKNALKMLKLSLESNSKRITFYDNLVNHGIGKYGLSDLEYSAIVTSAGAQALNLLTSPFNAAWGFASLAPNIFGLADGGEKIENSILIPGLVAAVTAEVTQDVSIQLEKFASYDRRMEEWKQQLELLKDDKRHIELQIESQEKQIEASEIALEQQKLARRQFEQNYDFMVHRFTGEKLFNWLSTQVSILFSQTFDAVFSICQSAQASWQYEMVDFEKTFFPPGLFDYERKGLLSPERLKLCLLNMESEYLSRKERKLEITKTISLKSLINPQKENYIDTLKKTGSCEFELTKELYDDDYPSHYQRQIVFVGVTVPAIIPANSRISMVLTQTSSIIHRIPDDEDPIRSYNSYPQVALSSGIDDTGQFSMSFSDEKYVVFEGTGAISCWKLTVPNKDGQKQKVILNSLTDIILEVRYTAKSSNTNMY